jgi:hypothetical protein
MRAENVNMSQEKPHDITGYKKWLKEQHGIRISGIDSNHYHTVTQKIEADFSNSEFWKEFVANLEAWNQEYQILTSYPLLAENSMPKLVIKPFESFFLKTFRKNILENR